MTSRKELLQEYAKYILASPPNKTTFTNKKDNNIRVLSFNVQLFKNYKQQNNMKELFHLLEQSQADIVILYEAVLIGKNYDLFYKNVEATEYKYVKVCNDKYGINIVLSKYQIESTTIIRLIKDPINNQARYAILVSINVSPNENKIIKIAGTHLDVYDETEITRLNQTQAILKQIDYDESEYLFIGDFNSLCSSDYHDERWKQIVENNTERGVKTQTLVTDLLKTCNFTDSFVKCGKDIPQVTVWCMRRIDYIYVGNKFQYEIEDSNCLITGVSDHFPIYIDININ
jgi:endonuclease/exonuclease/phosphatase family metal-dependent hydrolase